MVVAYFRMDERCSEEGCDRKVFSRGLCSMHYQRQRRTGFTSPAPVGRPRQYDPELSDKHGGAPKMTVRFDPEVYDWVREQGGATWVRNAARELKELSQDPHFDQWWHRFSGSQDD